MPAANLVEEINACFNIPNIIIILLLCLVGYGDWKFNNKFLFDVKSGLQQQDYFKNSELTENDMAHLPEPVKKYLRFTGSVGKPKVNNFRVVFKGKLRKNDKSEWMPFDSEQYNFMHTPTRLFFLNAEMKKLPVTGYHSYKDGAAFMDIRLLSLFRVQFLEGPQMNKAETVTFFNDMCFMAPATLIDPRIKWLKTEGNIVTAVFTIEDISISAELHFKDNGELINFKSSDRYNADAKKFMPWETPSYRYSGINGRNLSTRAEALYDYGPNKIIYGSFEMVELEYNIDSI